MHFCVLTSGPLQPVRMWQVPLWAPTVIRPEVKTENKCRHLAVITHTSTCMHIISSHEQGIVYLVSSTPPKRLIGVL